MKEFQDIKAEAEELAILKKEQFYRETLSVKLTEIVRDHLESKKPLQEIISKFEDDLTGLTSLACYMVEDILKDKSNKLPSPKKKKTVAAGELHLPPSSIKAAYYKVVDTITQNETNKDSSEEEKKELLKVAYRDANRMMGVEIPEEEPGESSDLSAEEYAKKYVDASQFITDELNKHNAKTLQEMVDQQAEEDADTAAEDTAAVMSERTNISTLDKITDEELAQKYFKLGLSVPVIASQVGVKPAALYKRLEKLRKEREETAKECVRQ